MLSAIRYDVYRTLKSASTWVILAVLFLLTCASVLILYFSYSIISQDLSFLGDMSVADWCTDVTSGDFLLPFGIIFAVICVSGEYSSGFIKNIYGSYKRKCYYIISKSILMVIFSICMIIVSYMAIIIVCPIALGAKFGALTAAFVKYTLAKILYVSACCVLGVLVCLLIRKGIIAICVLFGYSFILAAILYECVDQLFIRVFKVSDFDFSKYTLIGNISIINLETSWQQYLIGCGVAVVVLALCIILGSLVFKKRDC